MKKIPGNVFISVLSLSIICILLTWSVWNYRPISNSYGPRAIYTMTLLSVALALASRWLLVRVVRHDSGKEPLVWNPLFFIDVTVPLYLAAGALLNPPAAVLVALVTQGCLQAVFSRGLVPLSYTFYRVAAIGLIIFVATSLDTLIGGPPPM